MKMGKVVCSECGTVFTMKKNLYAHLRKVHDFVNDRDPVPKRKSKTSCNFCGNSFCSDSSLQRHLKNIHHYHYNSDDIETSRSSRLICPYDNCTDSFSSYTSLRRHLAQIHELEIDFEEMEFNSVSDFEEWKKKMQQETLSMYTLDSGKRTLSDGSKRKFFNCHRSYNYKSKGHGIKSLKSLGSNKMGKACPSRIEVTYGSDENASISVKFWKSHCGHMFELGRTFLDKQSRDAIADLLREGVSFDDILDFVRDGGLSEGNSQRIYLLNKKDLHNIIRDYDIDYITKQHQSDDVSVKLKVEKIEGLNEECSVLYYESEYEDISEDLEENEFDDAQHFFSLDSSDANDNIVRISSEVDSLERYSITNESINKGLIKRKAKLILSLRDKVSLRDDEIKSIINRLDKVIDILSKGCSINLNSVQNININKNIET